MVAVLLARGCAVVLGLCLAFARPVPAQGTSEDRETDPEVLRKLESWQDLKFGLLVHWGPYSQWGVVESWSICGEDVPWCRRSIDDYDEYLRRYEALPTTFDPVRFDPAQWAEDAARAGMRYLVFTTKHHDGFCMFDTAQTDYRITGPDCAFADDPRANVTRALFDAFRARGLWVGAYFSKPDWHHPDYWAPQWPHPDRNVNYDPKKYPERWKRFQDFSYRQIEELCTNFGPLDLLWLDGGWVRPENSLTEESREWLGPRQFVQDLDLPRIAAMARRHQPGLLVVDRTVHGRYENYRTPEQRIPDAPILEPWETCLTMGQSWSYVPDDPMKSTRELVHALVDVVSKGGSLLLNVGPAPDGTFPVPCRQRLEEIGAWMAVNGSAIHGTRAVAPYREVKTCFTRGPDGSVNAIYLPDPGEDAPPRHWMLHRVRPARGAHLHLLGREDVELEWEPVGTGALVHLEPSLLADLPCQHAFTLHISAVE